VRTSVRLKSTCVIITLVLPIDNGGVRAAERSRGHSAHCVSLMPVTTRVRGRKSESAATSGSTGAHDESEATSSGSLARSMPDWATNAPSVSVTVPGDGCSVIRDMKAVHWLGGLPAR